MAQTQRQMMKTGDRVRTRCMLQCGGYTLRQGFFGIVRRVVDGKAFVEFRAHIMTQVAIPVEYLEVLP